MTTEICTRNEAPSMMGEIIARAKALGLTLADELHPDRYCIIRELIHDVRVIDDGIRITLDRRSVEQQLQMMNEVEGHREPTSNGCSPIVLEIETELKRLGREKRLIVAAHAPETNPDPILIKAIARAHRWFEMLKTGEVSSISEIARLESAPRTYVSRLIPLAFLAPDITTAILEGRQSVDLTLDRLLNLMPLPLGWDEQHKLIRL